MASSSSPETSVDNAIPHRISTFDQQRRLASSGRTGPRNGHLIFLVPIDDFKLHERQSKSKKVTEPETAIKDIIVEIGGDNDDLAQPNLAKGWVEVKYSQLSKAQRKRIIQADLLLKEGDKSCPAGINLLSLLRGDGVKMDQKSAGLLRYTMVKNKALTKTDFTVSSLTEWDTLLADLGFPDTGYNLSIQAALNEKIQDQIKTIGRELVNARIVIEKEGWEIDGKERLLTRPAKLWKLRPDRTPVRKRALTVCVETDDEAEEDSETGRAKSTTARLGDHDFDGFELTKTQLAKADFDKNWRIWDTELIIQQWGKKKRLTADELKCDRTSTDFAFRGIKLELRAYAIDFDSDQRTQLISLLLFPENSTLTVDEKRERVRLLTEDLSSDVDTVWASIEGKFLSVDSFLVWY